MLHYLSFIIFVCLLPVNLAHISSLLQYHDQDMLSSRPQPYFTHVPNKVTKFTDPDIISVCQVWGGEFISYIKLRWKESIFLIIFHGANCTIYYNFVFNFEILCPHNKQF